LIAFALTGVALGVGDRGSSEQALGSAPLAARRPLNPALIKMNYGHTLTSWGTDDGLPQNTVSSILQTSDGYLWVGTNDGLARFDGIKFTVFNSVNTPAIRSNRIYDLFEDKEGSLWIASESGGLTKYSRGSFTGYAGKDSLPDSSFDDYYEDQEGGLWAAINGTELVRFKDGKFRTYTQSDGLPPRVVCFRFDPQRLRFWIGSRQGLGLWRPGEPVFLYTTRDGMINDDVSDILISRDGSIWAGTSNGLVQFTDGKFTNYTTSDGLAGGSISRLFEDRQGVLWVGTEKGGLQRFESGRFVAATKQSGIAGDTVKSLYEDREGNLWFGTNSGGLFRLKKQKILALTTGEGLPSDSAVPIIEDKEGAVWVGATCGGLVRLKNNVLTTYAPGAGLPKECIWSLWADDDGGLWMGTWGGGLTHFKDGKFATYNHRNSNISSNTVLAIFRDRKRTLWVGTGTGLNRFKDGEFTVYETKDGLVHNDVRFITEDRQGALWIGTTGGLSRYKDGAFTNYTAGNGLPHNFVRAIQEDEDENGVLWIGTYGGGLARFKDGKFVRCSRRNGLFDDVVSRILDDGRGNFWMSGNRGIYRVSKSELNDFADGKITSVQSISYGVADGMPTAECNGGAQPAGWKTRDGRLWFPTIKGIAIVDPAAIKSNSVPPPVAIEQVLIDKTPVSTGSPMKAPRRGKGDLEIHYTALSFVSQDKVRFKYKLEGYDENWVDAGTRRAAYYTNIPPGAYSFRVAASNDEGVWNEEGAAIKLNLPPHFYETRWFYAIGALLLALAAVGGYRLRVRRLLRRAEKLEALVSERTLEVVEQKDRLAYAKEQLEQANQDLLSVLDQLRLGVVLTERKGVVTFLSEAAQNLLGVTSDEAAGQSWQHLLPLADQDSERVKAQVERASEQRTKVPVRVKREDGRRYWMEIEVEDDPRDPQKKIFLLYDVSEIYDLRMLLDDKAQFQGLVGQSTAMQLVYKQIRDVTNVETTVLIEGETGTGKELVARAIHYSSRRRSKPFIAVNSAGLTESMLASQLFGHRRGSFTGAVSDHIGLFEAASGGTIFLDEIGDIPMSEQSSLLRVLQEKEITRLGESKPRKIDVRIIAATNRDLNKAVAAGSFRQDLLYRIRVAHIELPPLRYRRDDIPLLVAWFLGQARTATGKATQDVGSECMNSLTRYQWPGNVRELKSAIEFAVIRSSCPVLQTADLPDDIVNSANLQALPALTHREQRDERHRIFRALERAGGNRAAAARLLGIGRTTLYRRLKAIGMEEEPEVPDKEHPASG
ncbi:MAG TPA: sigma 54-interacting transcriptional regulator, partial [Blastocatellia bacterium]|nr:sigma 54-interacting transcriptional regulator [Blastocatellia bacterium]